MSTPIAEQPMVWACACGKRPWAHAMFCACGKERPAPPAAEQPLDVPPPVEADAYWMRNWR